MRLRKSCQKPMTRPPAHASAHDTRVRVRTPKKAENKARNPANLCQNVESVKSFSEPRFPGAMVKLSQGEHGAALAVALRESARRYDGYLGEYREFLTLLGNVERNLREPQGVPKKERPLCGAKTRAGGTCQARAVPHGRRCRVHGGTTESLPQWIQEERADFKRWQKSLRRQLVKWQLLLRCIVL